MSCFADGGTTIKVIAGECLGTNAYIETRTPMLFLDARIQPGKEFEANIPTDYNAFVYVWRGSGALGTEGKAAKMGDVSLYYVDFSAFLFTLRDRKLKVLLPKLSFTILLQFCSMQQAKLSDVLDQTRAHFVTTAKLAH